MKTLTTPLALLSLGLAGAAAAALLSYPSTEITPSPTGITTPQRTDRPSASSDESSPATPHHATDPQHNPVDGLVVGSYGTPVPGARVEIGDAQTRTDAAGRFTLAVAAGELEVRISHPDHAASKTHLPGPFTNWTFELGIPGSVSGRVITQDGKPVAGAHVREGNDKAITDAEGRFTLTGVHSGSLWMDAQAAGLRARKDVFPALEPGQDLTGVTIVMVPAASFTVRIAAGPGQQCRDGSIFLHNQNHSANADIVSGLATFPALAPGEYFANLKCDDPEMKYTWEAVAVNMNTQELTLTLPELVFARGCFDEPTPNDLQVMLLHVGEELGFNRTKVGPDGCFAFMGLPPGDYEFRGALFGGDFGRVKEQPIELHAGTPPIEAALNETHDVHIRVVDEAGEAMAGATVDARVGEDTSYYSHDIITDRRGDAFLPDVLEGKLKLSVSHSRRTSFELVSGAEVMVDSETQHTIVVKHPTCELTGRVLEHDGSPAARVSVRARGEDRGRVDAVTREDGTFTLPPAPEGEYEVTASTASDVATKVQARCGDGEIELALPARGTLTVLLENVPPLDVVMLDVEGEAGRTRVFVEGPRHTFTVGAGTYTVKVGDGPQREVVVEADGTSQVRLDLAGA